MKKNRYLCLILALSLLLLAGCGMGGKTQNTTAPTGPVVTNPTSAPTTAPTTTPTTAATTPTTTAPITVLPDNSTGMPNESSEGTGNADMGTSPSSARGRVS